MNFADELRAAATQERNDWTDCGGHEDGSYPNEPAIHLALANWLDHTASLIEGNKGAIEGVQSSALALVTARAINGGAS